MGNILLESSTHALVKALTDNLHTHIPFYSHMPNAILWDEPDLLALLTDLVPSESMVYRTHFTTEDASKRIEQVLQRFHAQGCLPMYWQVGPFTLPVDLGKYLQAQGFKFFVRAPGMAVNLQELEKEPVLSGNFVIEPVKNSDQLRKWVNIVAKVDEISDALQEGFFRMFESQRTDLGANSQLFLGMENSQPVATSRLFCAGGVAGIWHVATIPEARGRGYGTGMTLAAARAGHELGMRFGVLYATAAGYSVYCRLGFQEYCHIDVYKSPDQE
jgi:ribosomal protein S18 acetylase RimI-like enzyme